MPHKRVDPQVFERIDKEIAAHEAAIKAANVYRDGKDQEAVKFLLQSLKDLLEGVRHKKDAALKSCTEEGSRFALYMLGKQESMTEIIESFEDAESFDKYHKKEIDKLELEREQYKQYPLAD